MPVHTLNPDGLPQVQTYRQVAVATGSRSVWVAGQVARDAEGRPVAPGDLAGQTEQALLNVATALAAAGAGFADVVRLNVYVVDWAPEQTADLMGGVGRATARLGIDLQRPVTLVGVSALAEPDLLVEIEAVAVCD